MPHDKEVRPETFPSVANVENLGDGWLPSTAAQPEETFESARFFGRSPRISHSSRRVGRRSRVGFERLHLERMLRRFPDKKEAARRLGMGLSSLYRRIAELGIAVERSMDS